MASDRVVIDASYMIEIALPTSAQWMEEAAHLALRVAEGDVEGCVPWLFFAELAAVITKRARARRIDPEDAEGFLRRMDGLGLQLDLSLEGAAALHQAAQRWHCGAYDGVYLDLAICMHIPIATRDRGMITAARAAGVPLYSAVT